MSLIVLLGPQRFRPTVGDVVRSLHVEGPIATVTAGREEREPDDAELSCLHLFNVAAAVQQRPVVAWSAGAMALAETVVLFGDHVAQGPGHAEAFDAGLALARGVIPLPHARRRLRLDDRRHMGLFAQRFAPARCLALDDGARVDCTDGAVTILAA